MVNEFQFTALQGIVWRENSESVDSENKDTLLELMELIVKQNPNIMKKLEFKTSRCTHHTIQNELLNFSKLS